MIETLDAVVFRGAGLSAAFFSAASGATCRVSDEAADEPLPRIHTDAGTEVGFITTKVMRDLRQKFVFYAGGVLVVSRGGSVRSAQARAPPPNPERGMLDQ